MLKYWNIAFLQDNTVVGQTEDNRLVSVRHNKNKLTMRSYLEENIFTFTQKHRIPVTFYMRHEQVVGRGLYLASR